MRAATEHDMEAVGRFGAALLQLHHDFDPKRYLAPRAGTAQGYAGFLASQLRNPNGILLVAERDGALLGYAYATLEGPDYVSFRGPAAVFHDIFVVPQARGAGVGQLLFDAAMAEFRSRGAPRVVLSIAAQNPVARAMAEQAGFRPALTEMTRELAEG